MKPAKLRSTSEMLDDLEQLKAKHEYLFTSDNNEDEKNKIEENLYIIDERIKELENLHAENKEKIGESK